ncbi:MAG: hypothetical protein J1G01_02790 [Clostridiales bacterium]|nr:hypothetical protein [Clostridiales bacterium]
MEEKVEQSAEQPKTNEPDDLRERFHRTLRERAEKITSVRNDVYTTTSLQILLNLFMGASALTSLILTMVLHGTLATVFVIIGIVLVITLVVYNYTLRAVKPMSFLQYTYLDKQSNKRYCFQVLSKTRSGFSDGEYNIEVDRGEAVRLAQMSCLQYKFDFFADMVADMRIVKEGKEIYKGTFTLNDKRFKSKIVFKDGVPLYGSVGGGRIKYFDINTTKDKFVVPADLKRAAKEMGIFFPKLPGLYVRDDLKDPTKQ